MWHDEIGSALRRCDWFVLVLSQDAVTSQWVKRELLYSLQESRYEGRIVPLMYEPCPYDELSWTLASMQMVDFTNGFDPGCRDLLRTWGGWVPSTGPIAAMSSSPAVQTSTTPSVSHVGRQRALSQRADLPRPHFRARRRARGGSFNDSTKLACRTERLPGQSLEAEGERRFRRRIRGSMGRNRPSSLRTMHARSEVPLGESGSSSARRIGRRTRTSLRSGAAPARSGAKLARIAKPTGRRP